MTYAKRIIAAGFIVAMGSALLLSQLVSTHAPVLEMVSVPFHANPPWDYTSDTRVSGCSTAIFERVDTRYSPYLEVADSTIQQGTSVFIPLYEMDIEASPEILLVSHLSGPCIKPEAQPATKSLTTENIKDVVFDNCNRGEAVAIKLQ